MNFNNLKTAILRLQGFKIGPDSVVSRKASLKGDVSIGSRTRVSAFAMLLAQNGSIEIGNDCTIQPYCILYGAGGLSIGNGVRIATQVVVIPANHGIAKDSPIRKQSITKLGIVIEDDVWIGAGAKILDGVRLRKGSVIGAGAVVTQNTEPYCVYVGVPARMIKSRK